MIDQAAALRKLASQMAHPGQAPAAPRTLMLAGGRAGVGVTTMAVELGFALASDAQRVVLLDADLQRGNLAARCGASEATTLAGVLAGQRGIHETLQRGPAGLQVLAGTRGTEVRNVLGERSLRRLCQQLQSLGRHADWVIIDAGSEVNELTMQLAALAEHLWMVTSPDAAAVMDTYALVKTLLSRQRLAKPIELVVAGTDESMALDVHRRVDQSCRRFLGQTVILAGWTAPRMFHSAAADQAGLPDLGQSDSLAPLLQHLATSSSGSQRKFSQAA